MVVFRPNKIISDITWQISCASNVLIKNVIFYTLILE